MCDKVATDRTASDSPANRGEKAPGVSLFKTLKRVRGRWSQTDRGDRTLGTEGRWRPLDRANINELLFCTLMVLGIRAIQK
jgi:hypothetical protein